VRRSRKDEMLRKPTLPGTSIRIPGTSTTAAGRPRRRS
jgi:hypothetical protein